MSTFNAAAVVHIDETLDDTEIHQLEYNLAQQRGITAACVSEKARHLMVIDYDSQKTRSNNVLNKVMDNGYHAELIGGI